MLQDLNFLILLLQTYNLKLKSFSFNVLSGENSKEPKKFWNLYLLLDSSQVLQCIWDSFIVLFNVVPIIYGWFLLLVCSKNCGAYCWSSDKIYIHVSFMRWEGNWSLYWFVLEASKSSHLVSFFLLFIEIFGDVSFCI